MSTNYLFVYLFYMVFCSLVLLQANVNAQEAIAIDENITIVVQFDTIIDYEVLNGRSSFLNGVLTVYQGKKVYQIVKEDGKWGKKQLTNSGFLVKLLQEEITGTIGKTVGAGLMLKAGLDFVDRYPEVGATAATAAAVLLAFP